METSVSQLARKDSFLDTASEVTINDIAAEDNYITLYQGFRASYPKLVQQPANNNASKQNELQPRSRRQSVAIENLQKMFSRLLNERELLLDGQEEILERRVSDLFTL